MEVIELFRKLEIGHTLAAQKQWDAAIVIYNEILSEPNCPKNLKITVERAIDNYVKIPISTIEEQPEEKELSILKNNILQVDVFTLDPIPQIADKMSITDIDYDRLKEGIKKRGIQVPLVALPTFKLVCGYNRLKIAKELGLKTVPVEFKDIPYTQIFEYAMKDNIERRHLSHEQVITYVEEFASQGTGRPKKGSRNKTNEEIADTLGVSERTVQRAKKYAKKIKEVPSLKGKSIREVLEGNEPVDRKILKFEHIIGVNDDEIIKQLENIVEEIYDFNGNNGDHIKIVVQLFHKKGR